MRSPEQVAATLAICLLANRSMHPIKAAFQIWPRQTRVEKFANAVLDKDELPIEPHVAYAVQMIIRHFEDGPAGRGAPTEQQVISWIKEQGGIPALVLGYLASLDRSGI